MVELVVILKMYFCGLEVGWNLNAKRLKCCRLSNTSASTLATV